MSETSMPKNGSASASNSGRSTLETQERAENRANVTAQCTPKQNVSEQNVSEQNAVVKQVSVHSERAPEFGGQKGPEPTRYGDWEKNGRCTDF